MKIEINNFSKFYGKNKAINEVNLDISCGKVIGLIGRNGAGKTTLLKTLAGLLKPTSGSVSINGQNPEDNLQVLHNLFLSNDNIKYNKTYKVKYIIDISSSFYINWNNDTALNLLNVFDIDINKKVKSFSKGMLTILSLVIAFSSGVELLLLDEPTEGLDANNRKIFYKLILEEASKKNKTIIISSHLLSEIETLLEDIILINKGKVIHYENIDDIRNKCLELEGHKDSINTINDRPILHRCDLGEKQRIIIPNIGLDDDYLKMLKKKKISINPVNIQDTCIYLTTKEYINA